MIHGAGAPDGRAGSLPVAPPPTAILPTLVTGRGVVTAVDSIASGPPTRADGSFLAGTSCAMRGGCAHREAATNGDD